MKKVMTYPAKCNGCGTCEKVCSSTYFKIEDREKSAIRINTGESGEYTIAVCDQCGVCRGMCQTIALKATDNGVVRIDKKTCVGCLVCVGECLRDYMFYHDELPVPFKCVACGLCAKQCPNGALTLHNQIPASDLSRAERRSNEA